MDSLGEDRSTCITHKRSCWKAAATGSDLLMHRGHQASLQLSDNMDKTAVPRGASPQPLLNVSSPPSILLSLHLFCQMEGYRGTGERLRAKGGWEESRLKLRARLQFLHFFSKLRRPRQPGGGRALLQEVEVWTAVTGLPAWMPKVWINVINEWVRFRFCQNYAKKNSYNKEKWRKNIK